MLRLCNKTPTFVLEKCKTHGDYVLEKRKRHVKM